MSIKEREVMRLVGLGYCNSIIAARLELSEEETNEIIRKNFLSVKEV